jgi:hypothetical protein
MENLPPVLYILPQKTVFFVKVSKLKFELFSLLVCSYEDIDMDTVRWYPCLAIACLSEKYA